MKNNKQNIDIFQMIKYSDNKIVERIEEIEEKKSKKFIGKGVKKIAYVNLFI